MPRSAVRLEGNIDEKNVVLLAASPQIKCSQTVAGTQHLHPHNEWMSTCLQAFPGGRHLSPEESRN
jgi:hypothetical protein